MREAEFKVWLEANGSRDHVSRMRRLEAALPKLGLIDRDLDAAYERDGLADVIRALEQSIADLPNKRPPEELIPNSSNYAERLQTAIRGVQAYKSFCEATIMGGRDADRIRQYVLKSYIIPARTSKQTSVDVLVRDVNEALSLNKAWPNICQALSGQKFQQLASVAEPLRFGANMSTATIFRFQLDQTDMDDRYVLARFMANSDFEAAWSKWDAGTQIAFLALARTVHDAGLDWYHVRGGNLLHFGRKSLGAGNGWVLGHIQNTNSPRGWFSEKRTAIVRESRGPFTLPQLKEKIAELEQQADGLTNIDPRFEKRADGAAYWPDAFDDAENGSLVPDEEHKAPHNPTNLILYGPPGTGKTYTTARKAVELCDGKLHYSDDEEGRKRLMERYRLLQKQKRISFVTFHQNFSYEDFVEGLRPVTSGDENSGPGFSLKPESGIFKEICALADQARRHPVGHDDSADSLDLSSRNFWKMSIGSSGSEDEIYQDAVNGKYIALGWASSEDWTDPRYESLDAIKEQWLSKPRESMEPSNWSQTHRFRNVMQTGDIVIVPYGNSAFRAVGEIAGPYRYDSECDGYYANKRDVRWLVTLDEPLPLDTIVEGNFTMRSVYPLPSRRINFPALRRLIAPAGQVENSVSTSGPIEQFVLIIDEINRANISKVFGELITLIEPDKRLGKADFLTAKLPYSKTEFGVPANLHIVGTMNTADRSIALLDTALRRRFTFQEIAPQPGLLGTVGDIDLKALLTTINDRIEYLIDREHRIGHAFFIGCKTKDDVHAAMRDKVIPLLQEYFFEDWSRIHAVLGSGFIGSRKLKAPPGFDGEDRQSWYVRETFDSTAYSQLIKGSTSAEEPLADNDEDDAETDAAE